jgi:hypothetical protein
MNDVIELEISRVKKQFNHYRVFLDRIKTLRLLEGYEWTPEENELLLKLFKENDTMGIKILTERKMARILSQRKKK